MSINKKILNVVNQLEISLKDLNRRLILINKIIKAAWLIILFVKENVFPEIIDIIKSLLD